MNSPVAPSTQMKRCEVEPRLFAYTCPASGGHWIPLQEYLLWIERRAESVTPEVSESTSEVVDD